MAGGLLAGGGLIGSLGGSHPLAWAGPTLMAVACAALVATRPLAAGPVLAGYILAGTLAHGVLLSTSDLVLTTELGVVVAVFSLVRHRRARQDIDPWVGLAVILTGTTLTATAGGIVSLVLAGRIDTAHRLDEALTSVAVTILAVAVRQQLTATRRSSRPPLRLLALGLLAMVAVAFSTLLEAILPRLEPLVLFALPIVPLAYLLGRAGVAGAVLLVLVSHAVLGPVESWSPDPFVLYKNLITTTLGGLILALLFDLRKRDAAALVREHSRFASLVESSDAFFCVLDTDTPHHLLYASPQLTALLGVVPDDMEAYLAGHLDPRDAERLSAALATARAGQVPRLRHRLRDEGDEIRWLETSWRRAPDPLRPGQDAIHVIGREVTDEVRITQERAEIEARYRMLVERVPAFHYVLELRPVLRLRYVSPQVAILGLAPEALVEEGGFERWRASLDPADLAIFDARRDLGGGQAYQVEYRARHPDGRTIHLHDSGEVVAGPDGELTAYGVNLDVSDARQTVAALRVSESRFRDILEMVREGLLRYDLGAERIVWHSGLDRLFGPNFAAGLEGYLRGTPPASFPAVLDEGGGRRAATELDLLPRLRAGRAAEAVLGLRATDDEPVRWWRLKASPIVEAGRVTAAAISLFDMTEERAVESQLRAAQRLEAVGRLAGGAAHDIKNALMILKGSLARLRRERGDPAVRGEIETIERAVSMAEHVTAGLLAFSRRSELQPRPVDPATEIEAAELMIRRALGERVRLVLATPHDLGLISLDPQLFVQVLINLAINAADAMPTGGQFSLEVQRVEAAPSGPEVVGGERPLRGPCLAITARDTGSGMDPEVASRVFEPFFTTKHEGGTGLGLSTVYGIVRQSGGSIRMESALGRGTSLTLYFPLLAPAELLTAWPASATRPATPSADSAADAPLEILVAEDNADVRELLVSIFEEESWRVQAAGDASDAIAFTLGGWLPDLVVSDLVMPGASGIELVAALRRRDPRLPALFLTGYAEVDAPVRPDDPLTRLLEKPIDPQRLVDVARELAAAAAAGPPF